MRYPRTSKLINQRGQEKAKRLKTLGGQVDTCEWLRGHRAANGTLSRHRESVSAADSHRRLFIEVPVVLGRCGGSTGGTCAGAAFETSVSIFLLMRLLPWRHRGCEETSGGFPEPPTVSHLDCLASVMERRNLDVLTDDSRLHQTLLQRTCVWREEAALVAAARNEAREAPRLCLIHFSVRLLWFLPHAPNKLHHLFSSFGLMRQKNNNTCARTRAIS